MSNINENLRLEIGEAVDKWVNSLVDYRLQNLNIPDDSIIDIAASIKEGLRAHSASLVARMLFNINREQETIESEMIQLLNASVKAEQTISSILKPNIR